MSGRARPDGAIQRQIEVMGTVVSFDVRLGGARPDDVHVALARAIASLRRADHVFSTWKPHSPLSRLRRGELTSGAAPAEVAAVLELCARARSASGGWFDPWAAPGGVDPTGLVKGWAAERALGHLLRAEGLGGAMVNAGGDVVCWGRPAPGRWWRIGVRSPDDAGALLAAVEGAAAVATSGTYERGPHLFRPGGAPTPSDGVPIVSATVTGPELWMADALATGLAVGGTDALGAVEVLEGYEGLVVDASGLVRATAACPAEMVGASAA